MTNKRDDFTKPTIDILAKRVGYLCSNPACRKHTVGPNEQDDKATLIGIAAHIKAASPRGPRYDFSMTETERKNINNGIWLCANCAMLIDKDKTAFPIELLISWKESSENEMKDKILGKFEDRQSEIKNPFIEADLLWSHGGRFNRGFSEKNIEKFGGNVIPCGEHPIIFWDLEWNFSFVLHNNSRHPAFNLKLEPLGTTRFSHMSNLHKINNIPPYSNIDLDTKFNDFLEGTSVDADEIIKSKIPEKLNGLQIKMTYQDEDRKEHNTMIEIKNGEIYTIRG